MKNKILYNHLQLNKDGLYDQLETAITLERDTDFDNIGVKVTAATRIKILNKLIDIFKMIRYYRFEDALQEMSGITKRLKLHFNQLQKLNQPNYKVNIKYFSDIMKVLYSIIITSKKIR